MAIRARKLRAVVMIQALVRGFLARAARYGNTGGPRGFTYRYGRAPTSSTRPGRCGGGRPRVMRQ